MLSNGSFQASYAANNQMFGYPYDAAGNLLSDRVANLMTWDAESRISSVAGATYIYDAEGNRVEKQGATVEDTVYFGGQPIARYQAGQWTDLVYGPTGLLAEVPGSQDHAGRWLALPDNVAEDEEGQLPSHSLECASHGRAGNAEGFQCARTSDIWHCHRHTFASRLIVAGVDLRTAGELLGHKSPAMAYRYAHLAPAHTLNAVDRLVKCN